MYTVGNQSQILQTLGLEVSINTEEQENDGAEKHVWHM